MTLSNPTSPIEDLLQHREFVRALALRLTRDKSAAEDLEQETWLTAIEKPPRRGSSLRGWLSTVLRNLALERYRKDRRRQWRERERGTPEDFASPVELHERERLRERLTGSLRALTEEDRAAIEMRCAEGLPPREISARTGVPVETIYSRLKRGLSSMRRDLDREYGDRRNWSVALISLAELPPGSESAPLVPASTASAALLWKLGLAAAVLVIAGLWIGAGYDGADRPPEMASADAAKLASADSKTPIEDRAASANATRPDRSPVGAPGPAAPTSAPEPGSLLAELFWDNPRERAAGVQILLENPPGDKNSNQVVTTGNDGRLRIEGLAAGEWRFSPSHGPARRVRVSGSEQTHLEVVLERGPDLDLRVRSHDEVNHGVAEVFLSWPDRPETGYLLGRTDSQGYLTAPNISPDAWIWARAPGYGPSDRLSTATPLTRVAGMQKMLLDLTEPGPPLAIRVLDSSSDPVPGARVQLGKDFEPYFGRKGGLRLPPVGVEGWTDEDGTVRLESVRGQALVVRAGAPGYSPARTPVELGTRLCTVRLLQPARVGGIVRNIGGSAPEGVWIRARSADGTEVLAEAHSDNHGAYLLAGLPPGPTLLEALYREGEEYLSATGELTLEEGQTGEWSVALERAEGIGGKAFDAHGRPIPGWFVTLEGSEEALAGRELNLILPRPGALVAQTDEAGRFFFPRTEAGAHWIHLRGPEEEGEVVAWRERVQVGDHEVSLHATSDQRATARIVGRVRRPDGVIPGGTEIHVHGPLLRRAQRHSIDPETGEFEIGPLNPSRYRLRIWAPGYPAQDVPGLAVIELSPGELLDLEEVVRPWRAKPEGR